MDSTTPTISHVFISQAHLLSYGGSEMVTLELAEHFAAAGSKVTIGTWSIGPPLMSHLSGRPNIACFDLDDPRLEERLASDPPGLAWIHHQLVPGYLLNHPEHTSFVFNHMSSVHPLEMSWSAGMEARLAGLHLYNSPETLDLHRSSGSAAGFDADRMMVFANPAPDAFSQAVPGERGLKRRFGIVSNHVPAELAELFDAPPAGIEFQPIGTGGLKDSKPLRVTPGTFAGLDGVITIGKTVQYALLAGVPVYCYDKFGGPGWLGPQNFDASEYHNFSGRGFSRKDTAAIAGELVSGFDDAASFAAATREADDVGRFRLSEAVGKVVAEALAGTGTRPALDKTEIDAHLRQQKVVGHYARNWLRLLRRTAAG